MQKNSTLRYRPTTVLLVLWLGHFAVDSFTGIWPIYKTLAGLDLVKAGLIATVGGFAGNSLQIVFGLLGDRGWNRFLLCFGVLAAGLMVLVPYIDTSNYFLMGVLVLITYIGSSAFHPSGTGTASILSEGKTGKLTALFLTGGYVGYAFSQLIFTKIYRITQGQTAGIMLMSISVALLLFYFVPPVIRQSTGRTNFIMDSKGLRRPLTYLYVVMVCTAGVNMLMVFLLPDLLHAKQTPEWMVFGGGHMVMVMGGCTILLPVGLLADKYGPRQIMIGGLIALFVLLPVTALYGGENSVIMLSLLFLLGASSSTCAAVGLAYGNRLMPKHSRTVSGLLMGSAWCVAGVSTFIGGWLADPSYGGTPQRAILWMITVVVAALFFAYLLPRTKKKMGT
ncbi:MFS transporter [bacterium]|nr:MFS transporter [bacterium]